ncbi:MAG: hypothetical protein ACE15E_15955 [Acidobacteriota bacterium]
MKSAFDLTGAGAVLATKWPVIVAAFYGLSLPLQMSIAESQLSGLPHIGFERAAVAPPLVLSGDCPHYLVIINSLIEDGDFDLANNYRKAAAGGWQAGARFRGVALDHHCETDSAGREISLHSIFLPILLSVVVWPLAGTPWVETVCITVTAAAVLLALLAFSRRSGLSGHWMALLALATPLWCYSRDIWTEPWQAAAWIGLLFAQSPAALFLFGLAGTLIKCNFVLVPLSMAVVIWFKGDRRRAFLLAASGMAGVLIVIATAQYLFRDVDHFNLFHLGGHYHAADATLRQKIVPLRLQITGLFGMLLDPEAGLLPFFPFLAWGLWPLRKGGRAFLPVLVFLVVNGAYPGWAAGSGFSSRYIVPALPALVIATASARPRGYLFGAAVIYSVFWGLVGGLTPPLAYDRTPVGVVVFVLKRLFLWPGI